MSIYKYVNCATCIHNRNDLEKYPCKPCETFSEWEPKFSYEQMVVTKHETK